MQELLLQAVHIRAEPAVPAVHTAERAVQAEVPAEHTAVQAGVPVQRIAERVVQAGVLPEVQAAREQLLRS